METQNDKNIITIKNEYNMSTTQFLDFCWSVNKQNPSKKTINDCIQNAKIWTNIKHLGCSYSPLIEDKISKIFK